MTESNLNELEAWLLRLWTDSQYRASLEAGGTTEFAEPNFDFKGAEVYASVLKSNRLETMRAIFPRTARLVSNDWERLVLSFWRKLPELTLSHPSSRRFLINTIGEYFYGYFCQEEKLLAGQYPFMSELIHFEATEAELFELDREIVVDWHSVLTVGELSTLSPIVNPCLRVLRYQFDIPELVKAIDSGDDAGALCGVSAKAVVLLAVRNPSSHNVRVVEINELTALIVETAGSGSRSYQDLVAIAADHCLLPAETLSKHCLALFGDLSEQFVIVGNRRL